MNHFLYSNSNKRYHTLDYYYKNRFHEKIFKVSLNAGFSCPNYDGTVGYGGCIYCSKSGSGEYAGNQEDSLEKQFLEVKEVLHKKWPKAKYIAYFQARTNTYAPVEVLKNLYEKALSFDDDRLASRFLREQTVFCKLVSGRGRLPHLCVRCSFRRGYGLAVLPCAGRAGYRLHACTGRDSRHAPRRGALPQ